ncbi:zinc finger matrin-type protein 5-like [Neocloeon triangulifer]|uniref:zinc finger matrin-type protein 5-like n=1 Tax=Neocloeon triangulifer TaxID=2078957 RepID=UPI00286F0247|nr:zinc finger matrin-type protein 5-like [Neocloeon triangulifer]
MGRRYHCDYCEKSFKNDVVSIKKHLSSLHHERARQEYHAQFKDLATILQEESAKRTCSRFANGDCQFGAMCRFSHYSPGQLQFFRQQVEEERRKKSEEPSLTDWLQKRSTALEQHKLPCTSGSEDNVNRVVWAPPPSISMHQNLPPSLQPVHVRDFENFQPQNWG